MPHRPQDESSCTGFAQSVPDDEADVKRSLSHQRPAVSSPDEIRGMKRPDLCNVIFTMTTIQGTFTYSVPKAAFGGAPAAMKDGDLVLVCAESGGAGGQKNTTTITEFGDQGQPTPTGTPQSR